MNDYVVAGKKVYPLHEKIIRAKSGKEYKNKHVKITVATDFYSGKQIQHDYTGRTNFEVQSKIDNSICLNDEQLNLIPNEITVKDLFDEFFEYQKNLVSESFLIMERGMFKNYINPKIGKIKIKELKKEDIIILQDNIHKFGHGKTRSSHAFFIIKSAMNYACKKGYISYNPCLHAQVHNYQKTEQTILNKDQIYKLLVTEKENRYAGLYALILLMGLRTGEAIGLSWNQVNFERKTVIISQQINVKQKLQMSTKTKINRCITIPDCALFYLNKQRKIQEFQKLKNHKWNNPHNFVFTDSNGNPFSRPTIGKNFKRIMKDTSNPHVSLHSLRRTIASIIAENVSMQAVKYYLGHVKLSTSTRYVYSSMKDTEHLSHTMSEYFRPLFEHLNYSYSQST